MTKDIQEALNAAGRMCLAQDKLFVALRDYARTDAQRVQGHPVVDAGSALTELLIARRDYDRHIIREATRVHEGEET